MIIPALETPWGTMPVADAHVHFFSRPFYAALAAQKQTSVANVMEILGWPEPPEHPEALAQNWVRELDRRGVAHAALIASIPGDEGSVIAAVKRFPQRFHGYMMVDPCAEDAAARVLAALGTGCIHGLCFFPAMQRYSIQDARVAALLDAVSAVKPSAIVFVHCGALTVGVRNKLGLPSPFDLRFSNPIDLHAIALRYPQFRFVIPHFGAGYFREALMVADLCPNVFLDTSSGNSWMRYDDNHPDLRNVFRRALSVTGPSRLLFGTDSSFFPRGWNAAVFETQSKALYELGIEASDARLIFHDNLIRLFA